MSDEKSSAKAHSQPEDSKHQRLWTIGYQGCIEMSGRIEPLICRYRFKDAMQSVYCINSWYKNRPAQGCAMALNAALLSITEYGDTSIGTYE